MHCSNTKDTARQLIQDTCVNFSIEHISESAKQLYDEFFNKGLFAATDGNVHDWIVCAVYVSMIENRFSYGCLDSQLMSFDNMPCSVTDLLLFNNCRAKDFLVCMELIKSNLQFVDAVTQHLRVVQRKFLISCNLYRKLCQSVQHTHRSCWLYFINIKG
ncbi:hypothetical protein HELRODRAFT_175654 [Helobdella robusta]|uniref:Uncharacterized protein n=1 Tax=Helobdella robusta TaxID=6412 RepID=T1F9H3_HELRO|nr:hypothetical protein HELRODRAFT_175654 [Helobdella robusta]ESO00671.1 hypothetical protein HELRODRAFT_175654 [Helobdella robusta]